MGSEEAKQVYFADVVVPYCKHPNEIACIDDEINESEERNDEDYPFL